MAGGDKRVLVGQDGPRPLYCLGAGHIRMRAPPLQRTALSQRHQDVIVLAQQCRVVKALGPGHSLVKLQAA